jgi:hypothetical protein
MSLGEKFDLKLVYLQGYYLVPNQQNWMKVNNMNKDQQNDWIDLL